MTTEELLAEMEQGAELYSEETLAVGGAHRGT